LKKYVTNRNILIAFIIAHLAFVAMAFILPAITKGTGYTFFDLRMFQGYSFDYARGLIFALDTRAVGLYFLVQLPLDLIYPLMASLFFALLFYKHSGKTGLVILGFSSMVIDYLENLLVVVMLSGASLAPGLVLASSTVTIVKAFLYALNYGLAVFFLVRSLVGKKRGEQTS